MRLDAISKSLERSALSFSGPGFSGLGGESVGSAGCIANLEYICYLQVEG